MINHERMRQSEVERSLATIKAALETIPMRPERHWPEVWARVQSQTTQIAERRRLTWQSVTSACALVLVLFASGAWSSFTTQSLAANASANVVSAPLFVASTTPTAKPGLTAITAVATLSAHTPKYLRPVLTPIPAPPD